jgi:hypothetical protein
MSDAGMIYRHFTKTFPAPVQGALRIWWIPQIPGKPFHWPVADFAQAALMLDALAGYDDFQFAQRIKGDYANMGGLQIFDGEQWEDWEDEEGDDFDAWRDKQAAASSPPVGSPVTPEAKP